MSVSEWWGEMGLVLIIKKMIMIIIIITIIIMDNIMIIKARKI